MMIVLWRRKHSLSYLLCFAVFCLYLLFALDKVLLPVDLGPGYAEAMRQVPLTAQINLIPFYFGQFGTLESSLTTLLQNVALTVPFGFGISFIAPIRGKRILWVALAVGLSTEAAQLVISVLLGFFYRIIDINDVLMNALGVLVGYAIFRVFAWLYVWLIQRLGIKPWGLAAYIDNVARQHTRSTLES